MVTVKNKDVITVQLPHYKENQYMEFYNPEIDSWNHCKMIKVHNDKYELKNSNEIVFLPINTLKLR